MPVVVFESEEFPTTEVEGRAGERLLDVSDEHGVPMPYSCRSASCGTCRVDVLEGRELLDDPKDEELDVLDVFGDVPGERRLACQATLRDGPGRVRVRPAP